MAKNPSGFIYGMKATTPKRTKNGGPQITNKKGLDELLKPGSKEMKTKTPPSKIMKGKKDSSAGKGK